MHPSTAATRLKKMLLFDMAKRLGIDDCYRCREKIESIDNLSVEHKIPWLDSENPVGLFFDLKNIAFSHLRCNNLAGRNRLSPTIELICEECGNKFSRFVRRHKKTLKKINKSFCSGVCRSKYIAKQASRKRGKFKKEI